MHRPRRLPVLVALLAASCAGCEGTTEPVDGAIPAPKANSRTVTTSEDVPVAVVLSATVAAGRAPSFTVTRDPAHGQLTGALPELVYVPEPDFHGTDSLQFSVSDGVATSAAATVQLKITPVNDAPEVDDLSLSAEVGVPRQFSLAGRDVDGDLLIFRVLTQPGGGVLEGTAPNLAFTPSADAPAQVSLRYTAFDGALESAPGTVTITVDSTDLPPRADDLALSTDEDVPAKLKLSGSDPEGQPLSFRVVDLPTHGELSGDAPDLVYTPDADFHGDDGFRFRVNDGAFDSEPARVTITVLPVDDPLAVSAIDDQLGTEDTPLGPLSFTASDPDGDPSALVLATSSDNQGLIPDANIVLSEGDDGRTLTLTPAPDAHSEAKGAAAITLTVGDGQATVQTTFLVTIASVNDPPTITSVADQHVEMNQPAQVSVSIADVDDPLVGLLVSATSDNPQLVAPSGLELSGFGAKRQLTITPVEGALTADVGPATITIAVDDGEAVATTGFELTVTKNIPPIVVAAAEVTVLENAVAAAIGQGITVSDDDDALLSSAAVLLATGMDPGDSLAVDASGTAISAAWDVAGATLSLSGEDTVAAYAQVLQSLVFTTVSDTPTVAKSLVISVSDGTDSAWDIRQLSVTPVNDPPTVTPPAGLSVAAHIARVVPGGAGGGPGLPAGLLAVSADPEGDAVGFGAVTAVSPEGSLVEVEVDGGYRFDPAPGFTGAASFSYTVCDDGQPPACSAPVSVPVTVKGPVVWFVDAAAGEGGDGRMSAPLSGPPADGSPLGAEGDRIFVAPGDYSGTFALVDGQRLIGAAAVGDFDARFGLAPPPGSAPRPTLGQSAPTLSPPEPPGAGSSAAVTLAAGNQVQDVNIAVSGGVAVAGQPTGATSLERVQIALSGAGRALELLESAGTLTLLGGAITGESAAAGPAILLEGVSGAVHFDVPVSLTSGPADAVSLDILASGSVRFSRKLTLATTSGTPLRATGAGELHIPAGAEPRSLTATAGKGLHLSGLTVDVALDALSSAQSPSEGLALSGLVGQLTIAAGAVEGSAKTALEVGTDVEGSGGSADISFGGVITNAKGHALRVRHRSGGTLILSGDIVDTGKGIHLQGNDGGPNTIELTGATVDIDLFSGAAITLIDNAAATIRFSGGGLDVLSFSAGLVATSGAASLTITGAHNRLYAIAGAALDLRQTTIGAAGLTLERLSAGRETDTASHGVRLEDTGSLGGLTVTGEGLPGSGGVIQHLTGADGELAGTGIYLHNAGPVSLAWMRMLDFDNFAIDATAIDGLSLSDCTLDGQSGDAPGEAVVRLQQLGGAATISRTELSGGYSHNLAVLHDGGAASVALDDCLIGLDSASAGEGGLQVGASAGSLDVLVTRTDFVGSRVSDVVCEAAGTVALDCVVRDCDFAGEHPSPTVDARGVWIRSGAVAGSDFELTFDVSATSPGEQAFRGAGRVGVEVDLGAAGSASGSISGNAFGLAGGPGSLGAAMRVSSAGGADLSVLIDGNTVQGTSDAAPARLQTSTEGMLSATVRYNHLSASGVAALLSLGTWPTDDVSGAPRLCADVHDNTFDFANAPTVSGVKLGAGLYRLPTFGGADGGEVSVIGDETGALDGYWMERGNLLKGFPEGAALTVHEGAAVDNWGTSCP